jgi:hypothetical protein
MKTKSRWIPIIFPAFFRSFRVITGLINHCLLKVFFLLILTCLYLLLPFEASGQQSGRVYEFLSLPATARTTALGGYAIPDLDNDLGMALFYPALLNQEMSHHLSLNFVDYFDDIHYGAVAFSRATEQYGNFSYSIQYINYGRFTEADEFGQISGSFSAGEYNLMLGWGKQLGEHWFFGSNFKNILSFLYDEHSWGMAFDVSMAYLNPEHLFSGAFLVRNLGWQMIPYQKGNQEPLPFDLVLGVSKKLANAPFRLSMVAHNLHRPDLTYEPYFNNQQGLPASEPATSTSGKIGDLADHTLRHLVLGLEFIPGDNFRISMGYNYRRRQEMKVQSRLSTVGFSWGLGVRISRFHLHYGRANHHLAGAPNHISISTSLQDLFLQP